MSEMKPPLARLVLFMVCLSVAGVFVAGVHYVAVDQPRQQVLQAPENFDCCQSGADTCAMWASACQEQCKANGNGASCMTGCYIKFHNGGTSC